MEKPDGEAVQWKRRSFKGNKVWAAFDCQGRLVKKNNRVRIKYNLKQTQEYWIKPEHLRPEDQAVSKAERKKKAKTGKTGPTRPDQDLPEDCIRIYTCGSPSGTPEGSGIGILLLYKNNRKEICETIRRESGQYAQLAAIHRALNALKRRDLPVRIFTDSSRAVDLLNNRRADGAGPAQNRRLNSLRDMAEQIKAMMKEFTDLVLVDIKGCPGIKERQVAEFLAGSAIKKEEKKGDKKI